MTQRTTIVGEPMEPILLPRPEPGIMAYDIEPPLPKGLSVEKFEVVGTPTELIEHTWFYWNRRYKNRVSAYPFSLAITVPEAVYPVRQGQETEPEPEGEFELPDDSPFFTSHHAAFRQGGSPEDKLESAKVEDATVGGHGVF